MSNPLKLTRNQLAEFLPNQRAVKAFEQLFEVVPAQTDALHALVQEATVDANTAGAKAQQALGMIAAIYDLASSALGNEVEQLRAEVIELKSVIQPAPQGITAAELRDLADQVLSQPVMTTVTTLATARAIYGNNFDGSAALAQIIGSAYGGTGNGWTKFSGPTTAEKTFTLPNASATLLYSGGALGTPLSGTATNLTGTATALNIGGNAATVTTNANLTGAVTSVGNATSFGITPWTGNGVNGTASGLYGTPNVSVGTVFASGAATITDTTDSSSATTGSLKTAGGLGVAKKAFFGDSVTVTNAITGKLTIGGVSVTHHGDMSYPDFTQNQVLSVTLGAEAGFIFIGTGADGGIGVVFVNYSSATVTIVADPSSRLVASSSPSGSQIGVYKSANSYNVSIKSGLSGSNSIGIEVIGAPVTSFTGPA